jgi:hypothetical protein
MEPQGTDVRDQAAGVPAAGYDRVVSDTPAYGTPTTRTRAWTPTASAFVDENVIPVRNRVQWGPIIAGSLISLGILVVMAVLGVAIGASAFEPGTDLTDWGTGAGIYGTISALIAMFVGGWIAAKSAAVGGEYAGLMNGLLAGITTIVALLVLAALGVDNILGFLGGNLGNITNYAGEVASGADPSEQAAAFDTIEDGAWGTLIALLLGLGVAALGGVLGHNDRADLREGTGV